MGIRMETMKQKRKWWFLREKGHHWGNLFLVICWLACSVLFFCGCGKSECAICGAEAGRKVDVGGKGIDICEECYKNYILIQNLFDEEL